jgi:hypothetical protein
VIFTPVLLATIGVLGIILCKKEEKEEEEEK